MRFCPGIPSARQSSLHDVSFEEACELFTTDAPVLGTLRVYDERPRRTN
jgi:hypothetical protein